MMLSSVLIFLGPMLAGILLVHLVWSERHAGAMFFKICLGAGVGLGLNSLVYFLGLLGNIGQRGIYLLQIVILLLLVVVTLLRERRAVRSTFKISALSGLQWLLLCVCLLSFCFSALTLLNLTRARPEGTFDAWSIWNRAARFIYRDPDHWTQVASSDLYWVTHPDYPLLIPLNVTWGWERVGMETERVSQMQSALFSFALIGLLFAAVAFGRSVGQASLAALILMSTPTLMDTAYEQIADIPLSFFILAACVLMYFYFKLEQPRLLILSGFAAGLAAWTKNEGILFVVTSFVGLALAGREKLGRTLSTYLLGLAGPLLIVLYFKGMLAPANDMFDSGGMSITARILDVLRYGQILSALAQQLWHYAGWHVSIFLFLAIYAIVLRPDATGTSPRGSLALLSILGVQGLGYFATFLLTPHDLTWHLTYALDRLIFHLYPMSLFLFFCWITEPEKFWIRTPAPEKVGVNGG